MVSVSLVQVKGSVAAVVVADDEGVVGVGEVADGVEAAAADGGG
jgi:hypothetical protein